jgi:DNA polymerase III subunit delta
VPRITLPAFHKQIADGALQPIYVIDGEDEIGKGHAIDDLIQSVDEGLQAFNVDRLDASGATNAAGRQALLSELLTSARTLPMMAPRRLVVLLRADVLLFPKGKKGEDEEGGAAEKTEPAPRGRKAAPAEDPIESYIQSPERTTTLVFVTESLPMNRRIGKILAAQTAVVSFGTEMSDGDAARWLDAQTRAAKMPIDAAAMRALIARTGTNIVRLRSGLERLLLYTMGQSRITAEDVKQAVPAAPEGPENFGIANAVRRNDAATALRELQLALDAGAVPYYLLGQLRSVAEQLPAARLASAIDAVFRTDLALKSSGGDPRILLERLVVELATMAAAGGRRPTGSGFQVPRSGF